MNQSERQAELTKWCYLLTVRPPTYAECLELREVLSHTARFVDYAYRENRRLARQCNEQAGLGDV
jgi:hypothetical protein